MSTPLETPPDTPADSQQLRERLHLFLQVADKTPFGILITDRKGAIEYVNAAVCKISGYTPAELIAATPRLFASAETAPEIFDFSKPRDDEGLKEELRLAFRHFRAIFAAEKAAGEP
jgi:PAS domain S-box-containing protein